MSNKQFWRALVVLGGGVLGGGALGGTAPLGVGASAAPAETYSALHLGPSALHVGNAAAFATPSSSEDNGFDALYSAHRAAAPGELEKLADWCGSVRLHADREALFEAILHFDPAHEGAHKGLKHSRQRDGTWLAPAKKSEVKNANKQLETEGRERRGALAGEFFGRGRELLDAHAESPAADLLRWRRALVADTLAIDPNQEAARALGGESRRGEEWVLTETVKAKEGRAELKELVKQVVASVPAPETTEPNAAEKALGAEWAHAVATPRVRVLTDGDLEEARTAAVMCHAALELYGKLMVFTTDLPADYTLYILTNSAGRDAFVGNWPGWSDAERAQVKTWAGCGVPGDIHQARWDADAAHRLDGAVRHTLGLLTLRELKFDHQRCAWAWEGVGIYLTRELVGTRYTWYSTAPESGDKETKDLLGRLMLTDVNWVDEYYQRAKRGKAPTLAKLCGTRIDKFGVDDILGSYALAAYLIESRGAELPKLMRATGDDGGAAALAALFDGDLTAGDARLLRWLSERK
jgi:hypothetical protein